jgi:hypothetical protein
MKEIPTGQQIRDIYGLNNDSCYRYEQLGQGLYATFDIAGPNTNSIAGRTVWVRKYTLDSGGRAVEEYFAADDGTGELRLIRKVDNMGVVRRYESDDSAPLFAQVAFNPQRQPVMAKGARFEVTAMPKDMPAELHEWTVLDDKATIVSTEGTAMGYSLQYKIDGGMVSTWQIIPGYGVAAFTDVSGTTHQVCAARVCDANGTCRGAADCSQLVCD